jgi:hypothetical protein
MVTYHNVVIMLQLDTCMFLTLKNMLMSTKEDCIETETKLFFDYQKSIFLSNFPLLLATILGEELDCVRKTPNDLSVPLYLV